MRAIQIARKVGCRNSNCPADIDKIYVKGEKLDGFYQKETVYDYIRRHTGSIQVAVIPNPDSLPAVTDQGERHIISARDVKEVGYLMRLPRM